MNSVPKEKVWDPLVRIFHWLLVLAFTIAYLTEDEWMTVHVWAGYTIIGLLVFRVIWGFIGPRHARFADFIYRPGTVLHYMRDSLHLRAKRYLGHNPLGGMMVLALLVFLILTTLSGLFAYAVDEQAGPLAGIAPSLSFLSGEAWEEMHEFFANFTLFLVFFHILGVLMESFIHRENLIKSMITGQKRIDSEKV